MIYFISRESEAYNSSASYNRMRLISKGLMEHGIKVKIQLLMIRSADSRLMMLLSRYVYSYIKNLVILVSILFEVDKSDVVIILGEHDQYWMYKFFAKKTNLIIERTEYPSIELSNQLSGIGKFLGNQNLKYMKYASFCITCSSYLQKYYSKYVNDIFIIPLVVDVDDYCKIEKCKNIEIGEYIAYCGSFNNNKDGLPILLDAFCRFHKNHPKVKLVLIGSGDKKNLDYFKEITKKFGIDDHVIFTGSLPHEEVAPWLVGATILALARPNNKQAEGGIPSKVGEYLSSGVPCVITKTGDLPNYLSDGIDCFLCVPDSSEAFAKRLEDCYNSNRDLIGAQGRQTAKTKFSYYKQTERLIEFLEYQYHIAIVNS